MDPLVSLTGQPFAYAGGDPVNGSDPSGLEDDGGGSDGGTEGGLEINFDGPNDGDETQVLSSEVANEQKLITEGKDACNACGGETRAQEDGTASCPNADVSSHAAPNVTWGNSDTLLDHFERHGAAFGATSESEYADMAAEFRQTAIDDNLPAKFTSDGVARYYDPSSNTFGSYNANGTTKTFFKPDTRAAYWATQPGQP